jgi:hypothetical protein
LNDHFHLPAKIRLYLAFLFDQRLRHCLRQGLRLVNRTSAARQHSRRRNDLIKKRKADFVETG